MSESSRKSGHLPSDLTGLAGPVVKAPRRSDDEVLEVMPEGFVFQYTALWLSAVGRAVGARRGLPEKVIAPNVVAKARRSAPRTSTSQREHRGGARKAKPDVVGGVEFDNERDLNFKRRVDRKLRAIAREIRVWRDGTLKGVRTGLRRCSQCKQFGDDTWVYCPYDRAPMEEVDRQ